MHGSRVLHDISVSPGAEAPVYPGDPAWEQELASSIERGEESNVTKVAGGLHSGTHLDAPWHFLSEGAKLDSYGLERFLLPAVVVGATGRAVTAADIEAADIETGDAVLLRTDNSRRGLMTKGQYDSSYVALAPDGAEACVRRGASLVGIDYLSVDPDGSKDHPAHHVLLGADVLILEGVNLQDVPEGRYTLLCLPLKLAGVEASPVRAVLLERRPG